MAERRGFSPFSPGAAADTSPNDEGTSRLREPSLSEEERLVSVVAFLALAETSERMLARSCMRLEVEEERSSRCKSEAHNESTRDWRGDGRGRRG